MYGIYKDPKQLTPRPPRAGNKNEKMKIQDQTILSDKINGIKGNCLITTYACYLDLNVDDCPQIQHLFSCTEPEGFWDSVVDLWLKEMGYERVSYTHTHDPFLQEGFADYYFAWGMSPRGIHHQVIYKEGALHHDPHISRDGLTDVKGFELLRKL